jgi:hypothetical protein
MRPPKYTAEQIEEITDRIIDARMRWLRQVGIRLALQQHGRVALGAGANADDTSTP